MSENARRLVRDVGTKVADLLFAGILADSDRRHMDVVNPFAAYEMDPYHGHVTVGRPYLFAIRIPMDVRRGWDGLDYLAFEQTFNPKAGDYTRHALDTKVGLRHRFKCHDAVGEFRSLTDEEYAEYQEMTLSDAGSFLKMSGEIVQAPWGCVKYRVHNGFQSRDWTPCLTKKKSGNACLEA